MIKKRAAKTIEDQLAMIRDAYDRTVGDYRKGIYEEDLLPEDFRTSAAYLRFAKAGHTCNSGESEIEGFLDPSAGDRYLDVGSGINLIGHDLYRWPSLYFGIDISAELTAAARRFCTKNGIRVGGLIVAEASRTPFRAGAFNILSAIGVLEYYDIAYIASALGEFRRVLKPDGRAVVDMPNSAHQDTETMFALETHLGRPRFNLPNREVFERETEKHFIVDRIDDAPLMIKYFLRAR